MGENIKFGSEPMLVKCKFCDYVGVTITEFKNSIFSYILTSIFLLLFGFLFGIILAPLVLLMTRTIHHRCQNCLNDLGSDNNILTIFNLQDKLISLKIGEIGIVLTRKLLLTFILIIVSIFIISVKINQPMNHSENIYFTDAEWPQFIDECGRVGLEKDILNVERKCQLKYLDKTVFNWKGYVIRIDDYRESLMRYMHHAALLLVRMQPSESEYYPDILLTFDTYMANLNKDALQALERGECVTFNATIKSLGTDYNTRHFHAIGIEECEGYLEIPPHIHQDGRYADRPKLFGVLDSHSHSEPPKTANVIISEVKPKDSTTNQNSNQNPESSQESNSQT